MEATMADAEDDYELVQEAAPVPSYGDNIAQRAQAFQYLAVELEKVADPETKRLGHAMLKALVEKVQDKPLRGLKAVETGDG